MRLTLPAGPASPTVNEGGRICPARSLEMPFGAVEDPSLLVGAGE